LHRDGEKMFGAMFDTYRELLRRVEKRGASLSEPVGLGLSCKLRILTRAVFRASYETTVLYAPAGATR
jgi:hypothetical protein